MCDIFPTFEDCCGCIDIKIGIMMIAMLSIVTGGIMMSVAVKTTKASIKEMMGLQSVKSPEDALKKTEQIIRSGIIAMSVLFMLLGVILLLAILTSQEGFIQVFVWVMLVNVILGLVLVGMVFCSCATKDVCILSDLDWLTGAALLILSAFYLLTWIYFISVANSLVVLTFG